MASNEESLKRQLEERKKRDEEDRRQAEEEFLKKHREEKRLGKEAGHFSGPSRTTSMSSLGESDADMDSRKRGRDKEDSPDKPRKKKGVAEEDDEEVEFGQDPLQNMDLGLDLLEGWLKQPTIQKMVTKPQQKKLERIVKMMRDELIVGREERVRLETRAEERGTIAEIVRDTVREELGKSDTQPSVGTSYASAVGRKEVPKVPKITGVKGPVQPAPKVVIVRHEVKESEEVMATLKRLVKPSEIGLKVRRLTKINKGVIVEVENEEGVEKLMKNQALTDAGMKVGKPAKKNPVIMVYDVSSELNEGDVKREIFGKNFQGCEIVQEEFNKEFEIRHRHKDGGSKGKKVHIVVECSVRVRNLLRSRERVFIEWQSCRVKDYVDVARCYKCQRYGHVAKHCNAAKSECSYCAGEHEYKVCPNKSDKTKVRCVNCKREGREDDRHDAGWRRCPAYERAVKRENEKIDYGL